MWLDLRDPFCDIPQAFRNTQSGLISTGLMHGVVMTPLLLQVLEQHVTTGNCAQYITCNVHGTPAKESKRRCMKALPILFVDLRFICLRQPIMKQQAWFPLQSSEAATVTAPKYIRNVRGIL